MKHPSSVVFEIASQPDEITCGPACLYSAYRHYHMQADLHQVIDEVETLPGGGTLAVHLALHAMAKGMKARIYTCDLKLFDPSWFQSPSSIDIVDKLKQQMKVKHSRKLNSASRAYIAFLRGGGELKMCNITADLLIEHIRAGHPVIVGLNATWLYGCRRDRQDDMQPDDILGESTGHFVVVHAIDPHLRTATIADPYLHQPYPGSHNYTVELDHLIHAILLGIVTDDAKVLLICPHND